jgi:hypothetical protein
MAASVALVPGLPATTHQADWQPMLYDEQIGRAQAEHVEAGYRFGAYKFALGEFVAREDRLIEINASSMRLRAEIVRVGGSKGLAPT